IRLPPRISTTKSSRATASEPAGGDSYVRGASAMPGWLPAAVTTKPAGKGTDGWGWREARWERATAGVSPLRPRGLTHHAGSRREPSRGGRRGSCFEATRPRHPAWDRPRRFRGRHPPSPDLAVASHAEQ